MAFALFGDASRSDDDSRTIDVERRDLLGFLQFRANAFEPETFGTALDSMTDAELDELVNAYVDEEILYREALGLGLEKSDNIIRQRMVQKMNFLLADTAATEAVPDEAALEAYFEANIDAYAIAPSLTFTHVFFDSTRHGDEGARAAAEAAKHELNTAGAGFNDAPGYGDRFPYLRNYVERTTDFVASHFGTAFADRIARLEPSASEWQGPLPSVFGQHLVLLTERTERRVPTLDDVRDAVERDYTEAQSRAVLERWIASIRDLYHVEVGELRTAEP
jgi:hypothetical protein